MPQLCRGKPRSASRFLLPDGRAAVRIPRERKHLSKLQNGYPLAEAFLEDLAREDVEIIAIDDEQGVHLFDLHQYRRGNRVGHAPYPMKRVAPLEEAAEPFDGPAPNRTDPTDEWEWVTSADLEPADSRTDREESTKSLPPAARNDPSLIGNAGGSSVRKPQAVEQSTGE